MRVKQTPNNDYVVDIDLELLNKLGIKAGDEVHWSPNGRLKRGAPIVKFQTTDGSFAFEVNKISGEVAIKISTKDGATNTISIDGNSDYISDMLYTITAAKQEIENA